MIPTHTKTLPGRSGFRRVVFALALCAAGVSAAAFLQPEDVALRGQASNSVTVSLTVQSGSGGIPLHIVAIPEKRIPNTGNNSTLLTVEVREPGSASPLFSQVITTGSGGTYSGLLVTGLDPGTYDLAVKGYSHLRVKKSNVAFSSGTTVDFTDGGTNPLPSGDVNSTDGDNKVNGIDLTLIVGGLTGTEVRYDLNRDGVVNGIDLTNAVSNLNDIGDA